MLGILACSFNINVGPVFTLSDSFTTLSAASESSLSSLVCPSAAVKTVSVIYRKSVIPNLQSKFALDLQDFEKKN